MRIGVSITHGGRFADPTVIRSTAVSAEQIGYSSIWVLDRLRASGPTLDPIGVLTYAAAVTTRLRLGTRVFVTPWMQPALLARSLATLDVLSDGRLTVGLGLGTEVERSLDVFDNALIGPCLVPEHRLQVLLDACTPVGLDRIARRADGWNPADVAIDLLAPTWAAIRDAAARHGRDPDDLRLIPRASVTLTDQPIDGDRAAYTGSFDQVIDDIAATRAAGAHEIVLGLPGDPTFDQVMETYAGIAEALDLPAAVPQQRSA